MLTITSIPTAKIVAGDNDRTQFDPAGLQALADSFQTIGLAQPITVRPTADGYRIVAGERRFRASQLIGWTHIDAIVRDDLTDDAESGLMLAENVTRVDLDPVTEAAAYRKRLDDGWTIQQLSEATGISDGVIRQRLRLLDLHPHVRSAVACGELWYSFAIDLTRLDNNRQLVALETYLASEPRLGLHAWRALLARLREDQNLEAQQGFEFNLDSFDLADLEAQARADKAPTRGQLVALIARAADALTGTELGDTLTRIHRLCQQ